MFIALSLSAKTLNVLLYFGDILINCWFNVISLMTYELKIRFF